MKHVFPELVPEGKVEVFRNYKYAGSDNSILYEYVLSPTCDYLVNNWIPPYLALPHQTQHS